MGEVLHMVREVAVARGVGVLGSRAGTTEENRGVTFLLGENHQKRLGEGAGERGRGRGGSV